ncbi:SMP-30/gluconolactonase/LRE family protein [Streptomyces sp. DSM 44915]|uniref:SMP-30/gluconolactonase/LRE family protein n=1 Tax=Streptomyces chisholmiae TaxID=3075540 RepID=A0ABU2JUM8_9ACTN|nr:SMP-30/gluconolactonase/LRE family protein [Streptomyces sp. DSM 44915]MDT0268696.1 SMP-30/gluconolactonase/LRE family protein [Streptomyces sp. DSM 44915]
MTAYQPPDVGPFRPITTERLRLGEGPRLLPDGTVVLVDILTGRLLRLPTTPGAEPTTLARLSDPLGAVAPLPFADGRTGWLAATGLAFAVLDPDGRVVRSTPVPPRPGGAQRMNDAACDRAGQMWAGTMAYDATPGSGALHLLDTEGTVTTVLDGLTIPNGPALSPDGRTLYLADSAAGTVDAFTVTPGTVQLADRRPLFHVDPAVGSPDGMTVDSQGCLWSAIWGAGQIRKYAPDGTLLGIVEVPAAQPSSVCLTGRALVVTTASLGLANPGPYDGAVLSAPCSASAPPAAPASPALAGPPA